MKIYFICSPSSGILDNWLPILHEYKKNHSMAEFICYFPKAQNALQVIPTETIGKLCQFTFQKYIATNRSGIFVESESLVHLQKILKESYLTTFLAKKLNQISRHFKISIFEHLFKKVLAIYDNYLLKDYKLDLSSVDASNSKIFFDVAEECKKYNEKFLNVFMNSRFYSLNHGININTDPRYKRPTLLNRASIKVLMFSKEEISYYSENYLIPSNNLYSIGIPRHKPAWIQNIREQNSNKNIFSDHVFIISRPISDYLPYDRKLKAAMDIKSIIIDKLNLKVVVKLHPKELSDGIFEKVFGIHNLNKTWQTTELHPFSIAEKSLFAISFYSGVCTDMIVLGVPTIEYLNLDGIKKYETKEALRDDKHHVLFSYRSQKLVFGVSTREEFEECVSYVINHKKTALAHLNSRYEYFFGSPLESIAKSINVIDS